MVKSKHSAYAPRNVLNAPEIKIAIQTRSEKRQDSDEIKAWLTNHFFRHIVANFVSSPPEMLEIKTLEQAKVYLKNYNLPQWLLKHLASPSKVNHQTANTSNESDQKIWWIDPSGSLLLQLEQRLIEFLSSRQGTTLEGKLDRVNCPQALAIWSAEHTKFENSHLSGWREHSPDAVQVILNLQDAVLYELVPNSHHFRSELVYESQYMRHCLGRFQDLHALTGGYGEHYASLCEQGKLRIFCYRTGQNQPKITISGFVNELGLLTLDQIKGKQNIAPVAKYFPHLLEILNFLPCDLSTPSDALAIGLVRLPSAWKFVTDIHDENEQAFVVMKYPQLTQKIQSPCAWVQWLIAGIHPEQIKEKPTQLKRVIDLMEQNK